VHKAASMFLHKLGTSLSKKMDFDFYSINNKKYYDEIQNSSWKSFIETTPGPACFGPIRAGEDVALPVYPDNIEQYSVVLHLRDPRDVLTSAYYSHVYSHKNTKRFKPTGEQRRIWEEQGVDNFVLNRIARVKEEYESLCEHLLGKQNVILLKYEDMVTNYEAWLKGYLSAFADLEPRKKLGLSRVLGKDDRNKIYDSLYSKYKDEFTPRSNEEDVYSHKRQITPGDYERKLKKSSIVTLNNELFSVLGNLGY
jgi:hypothetical protein